MGKQQGTPTMRAFAAGVMGNVPVLFEDHPGRGKSAKITKTGENSGWLVKCVVGSVREATDFLGLPVEDRSANEPRVTNIPPDFAVDLNAAPKGLLFLDEINTAMESTRKAMLRLLQERYAGDYKLHDHVRIVAAQNPPETSVGGVELDHAIANRMMHLAWAFDLDEWMRGMTLGWDDLNQPGIEDLAGGGTDADHARATSLVTGFINAMPAELTLDPPTDPVLAGKAWASPRSWSNLRDVLAWVDADDEEALSLCVEGLVGEGSAKKFLEWLAISDLHNPSDVLADPSIVDWRGERPDRLFGLMSGIEAIAVSKGDADTWMQAMEVLTQAAEHGRPDVALVAVSTLLNKRPKGTRFNDRNRNQFGDLMSKTEYGYATNVA